MNRTDFIRSLFTVAAGLALATSALGQQAWKVGTVVAPPSMLGILVDEGAASVKNSTGGRVAAERYQSANEQEITQNLIRGRIEMGYISATGMAVAVPEMGVLNTPYLWTSEKERDYVSDNFVAPFLERLLASKGLTLVKVAEAGWTNIFCKTACTTPDKLKGMKLRVSPTAGAKMFSERLGANGVGMSLADFYPALQQGVVDAGDLTFGFYLIGPAAQAAPHYVFTRHNHQPAYWLAHKGTWDKLSPSDQAAIIKGLPSAVESRARVAGDEVKMMERHRSRGGFAHELTDAQRAEWAKVVVPGQKPLIDGLGGRAKELFDLIQKGKKEFAALKI
jgi:TRAP-type C4-dicarboxylate transport system substrate-binding protein